MGTLDDYSSGRIFESVKRREQLIEEYERTRNPTIKKELKNESKGAKERHFLADLKTLKSLIDQSQKVAIGPRICLEIHNCQRPSESVFLDELADALIEVRKARKVTKEEAFEVLRKGKERGYPHLVTIVSGKPQELCNSCTDCCILWKLEKIGIENIRK